MNTKKKKKTKVQPSEESCGVAPEILNYLEAEELNETSRVQEVGAFEAKTHLSSILAKVAQGDSYFVTKHGKRVAEIRPIAPPKKNRLGGWEGKGSLAPGFDDPLPEFSEYMH